MPRPMPGAWVRVAPRLQASLEILDIFSLRPHEQVQKALLEKTMREIVEEGRLTTWPGATVDRVSKEEVVDHGMRGQLFPPKTTRHLLNETLPESPVALKDLM